MPQELTATGLLPSPPGVVMEILRIVGDETSTVDDLAAVIDTDPVLAAKLLGTVNSGLYTLVREIHSIDQAAVLVGFRAVRTLALGASVSSSVPAQSDLGRFDVEVYWRHCLMTAVLAKLVGGEVRRSLAEDAFAIGLIGHIGRLAVAQCVPDRYAPAVAVNPWPPPRLERAMLGYTTAEVGAALLRQWGLPPSMCAAVRYRDDWTTLPAVWDDETRLTTRIAGTCDEAVVHLVTAEDDQAIAAVASELADNLDLGLDLVHELLDSASTKMGEVHHLVSNSLPAGINPGDLLAKAQELLELASV